VKKKLAVNLAVSMMGATVAMAKDKEQNNSFGSFI
jgi:hypothetical protein